MAQVMRWAKSDIQGYPDKAAVVNKIVDVLMWISPVINPACGTIAPPAAILYDGMLAYADGSGWNPGGTGKGLYRYNLAGAAWVKIG